MLDRIKGRQAIIYGRFSSVAQGHGFSEDRQIQNALSFAGRHNLSIVQDSTYFDKGLSGFHGHHQSKGALGVLLSKVQDGTIKKQTVLLVEDLDRLSRREPMEAFSLLHSLIESGIVIVTISDSQVYDKPRMSADIGALYVLIGKMHRAHDESRVKHDRAKAGWDKKRAEAKAGKTPSLRRPFWIDASGALIPDRAQIVREVFDLYVNKHLGIASISNHLNKNKVPTASGRGSWHQQNLSALLKDRTVLGYWGDYKVYPAAIDRALYVKAQAAKESRKGTASNNASFTSCVKGVALCGHCGSSLKPVKSGKKRVLYCRKSLEGACEGKGGFGYKAAILVTALVLKHDLAQMVADDRKPENKSTDELEASLSDIEAKLKRLARALMLLDDDDALEVVEEIKELKATQRLLNDDLEDAKAGVVDDVFERVFEWHAESVDVVSKCIDEDREASLTLNSLLLRVGLKMTLMDKQLHCRGVVAQTRPTGDVLVTGGVIRVTDDGTEELGGGYWFHDQPDS